MERKRKSTRTKKNKERKKKKKGNPSFSLSPFVWIGSMAEPGDSIAVPQHASVRIHVMHASVQANKKFFVHYPHKKRIQIQGRIRRHPPIFPGGVRGIHLALKTRCSLHSFTLFSDYRNFKLLNKACKAQGKQDGKDSFPLALIACLSFFVKLLTINVSKQACFFLLVCFEAF